jgi:hypothetical protein
MIYPVRASFHKLAQYFRDIFVFVYFQYHLLKFDCCLNAEILCFEVADNATRTVLGRALLRISDIDASHPFEGYLLMGVSHVFLMCCVGLCRSLPPWESVN